MSASLPITETIILHLRDGVNLENVSSGTDAALDAAAQSFVRLTDTVKVQNGFVRQFWGHQVEDTRIFVWSIDWDSFEDNAAFTNSDAYRKLVVDMGELFEAAPLTTYTRFDSDATAAFASVVTEVAILTVPDAVREEAKTTIETTSIGNLQALYTVGKSTGGASGWVFESKNVGDAAGPGESIALHAVFGYRSVEDHTRWRQTPEHAQVIEEMGRSPLASLGMKDAKLPGGYIFVPDSSMFHVRFCAGV